MSEFVAMSEYVATSMSESVFRVSVADMPHLLSTLRENFPVAKSVSLNQHAHSPKFFRPVGIP